MDDFTRRMLASDKSPDAKSRPETSNTERKSAARAFALPLGVWGIYAVSTLAWALHGKNPVDLYELGKLCGGISAVLVCASIAALVAWLLSGRSSSAGKKAFFVGFGLAALGQLSQIRSKTDTPTRDYQLVAEANKAFIDEQLAVVKRYNQAAADLDAANVVNLANFAPGAPAEVRRQAVRAFAQASTEMTNLYDENGTALRHQLELRGASPAAIRESIAGYKRSASFHWTAFQDLRNCEDQIARVLLEYIDFAESNHKQWHIKSSTGRIVFTNKNLGERYDELTKRLAAKNAERIEYQKQAEAINPNR